MALLIERLMKHYDFCIITGGTFAQIEQNVITKLPDSASANFTRLHAMPTSGSTYLRYDTELQGWKTIYNHSLSSDERKNIMQIIEDTVKKEELWELHPEGAVIQDRTSQITFSALGQLAKPEAKRAWDPKQTKRKILREKIASALPDYEVVINGNTSIDVLQQGIDKGFGLRNLMRYGGLLPQDVLFIGDSLQPGGNDHPVLELGIQTIEVGEWRQTEKHLSKLLTIPNGLSV